MKIESVNIGKKLKRIREELRYTQIVAANKIGINNKTLSDYERNISKPDIDTLNAICKFYNVSIDYLLDRDDRDTPLGLKESEVMEIIKDDPNLIETFKKLMDREDTAILFSKVKDLTPKAVKKILKLIEVINDEEDKEINE